MPYGKRLQLSIVLAVLLLITACASTRIAVTGSPLTEPLCRAGGPSVSTVVYWAPKWRPNQKEPARREAAALRGIQDFFSHTGCLAVSGIHRLAPDRPTLSKEELLRLAASSSPKPERLILIIVRELGPWLIIGLPVVVQGGTEVLIDVRVFNVRTSESLADAQTSWRNGGTFVIKGVTTLDQDMHAALTAALFPDSTVK